MKTIILIFLPITILAQTWTDPINISPNFPVHDGQPDLCIDKNGILHCVFTHKLDNNWRKIYYSKSSDDGATWTTPEDISLNPDTSLLNPHIAADTNNKLFVTYDYNTMNPAATLIKLKTFDGNLWSEPFVVSEGMYNSDNNRVYIDNNNKVYIIWLFNNQLMYYRYFESNTWSEIICPYPGDHDWMLFSATIDNGNDIHCVGYFSDPYPPVFPQSIIYFKYEYLSDYWSDNVVISINASGGGADIDINLQNNPCIAYRKSYIGGPYPYNDSTMYTFFNGTIWSEPELVVNDPYEQKMAIDPYNRVHIIDREKLETGTKLVHYQKINDMWQGYIIDESDIVVGNPVFIEKNNVLYLMYYECYSNDDCKTKFTKNYLTTGFSTDTKFCNKYRIYPNPFKAHTSIEFNIQQQQQIEISIYDLNGKQIKTIENKEFSPGTYKLKWLGTDKNGKEVKAGLYLVRLLTGRHVITKPVEYVK